MSYPCTYNQNKECDGCNECKLTNELLCEICEEEISNHYYEIGGEIYCDDCLEDLYGRYL